MPTLGSKRIRWEIMDIRNIALSKLAPQYLTTFATEGKTSSTVGGHRGKLGKFVCRVEDPTLSVFSTNLAREYIFYLISAAKFRNHPFRNTNSTHMLAANV